MDSAKKERWIILFKKFSRHLPLTNVPRTNVTVKKALLLYVKKNKAKCVCMFINTHPFRRETNLTLTIPQHYTNYPSLIPAVIG